jgi:Ca2+-binding RTX toxin-like protein
VQRRRVLRCLAVGGLAAIAALTFAISSGSARSSSTCFGQLPTILAGDGGEDFVGTAAVDVILAGAGNDSIHGLGGDDLLCGGLGRDQIDGGQGSSVEQAATGSTAAPAGTTCSGTAAAT